MRLEPFLLDQWLAAHEFADQPIRYNLASSTGPQWTVAELLHLGGDVAVHRLLEVTRPATPTKFAIRINVDPDLLLQVEHAQDFAVFDCP